MPDLATNIPLSVAGFAGAFVASLAGFAFSAVAGAILLRVFSRWRRWRYCLSAKACLPGS